MLSVVQVGAILIAALSPLLAALASELGGETFALDATDLYQVEGCIKRATELFGEITGVSIALVPCY